MEQVAIFCDVDDFCKAYEEYCMHSLMMEKTKIVPRTRMALSEIMTILINVSSMEKSQSTRHKMPFGMSEAEQIEGFLGRNE